MHVRPRSRWTSSVSRWPILGLVVGMVMFTQGGCLTSYVVSSATAGRVEPDSQVDKTESPEATSDVSVPQADPTSSSSVEESTLESSSAAASGTKTTQSPKDTSSPDTLPACPGKKIRCGLLCVDVRNDGLHCGGCFVGCAEPASCVAGQCLRSCDHGCRDDESCNVENRCTCKDAKVHCGAECVDLGRSPAHCGACGHACAASQVCVGGQCRS